MDALWTYSFCLACDKQAHSSAEAYCSESCRLADLDKNLTSSSQASSPGAATPSYPWTSTSKSNPSGMHLSPAYDFANAKPYGTSTKTSLMSLTPSSSHSSLCSMQSTSTTGDMGLLSDKARKELRAYAVSFDPVRTQRRRSY